MTSTSKSKSLVWIIVFLLLTNLAMLFFFITLNGPAKRNTHGREDFIGSFLQKDIRFDSNQMRAYQNLKDQHMQKIKPKFDSIRLAKSSFYNLLYSKDINDSDVIQKANTIGENQKLLDLTMFSHLKEVRKLCTPEQLPKFDSSFTKVIERMIGRGRKSKDEKK